MSWRRFMFMLAVGGVITAVLIFMKQRSETPEVAKRDLEAA